MSSNLNDSKVNYTIFRYDKKKKINVSLLIIQIIYNT